MECSYVVKHIRTKTVSVGIYTLCIVCRNKYVGVCLSDSALIIAFKMTSSCSMIVCTQKSLCLLIIKMNADDGSSFLKKLLLVFRDLP